MTAVVWTISLVFLGVLVGTSGHRPGVILNLTTEEFENCKEGQDGYAIFVSVLVVIVFFHICLFKYIVIYLFIIILLYR